MGLEYSGFGETSKTINKLSDSQDLHRLSYKPILRGLIKTKQMLEKTKFPWSSHMSEHWLRYWEYAWAIVESGVDDRMHILDAGGTGTLFSYYLAIEGCKITTIDLDSSKVEEANHLTKHLKLNNLHHFNYSILDMLFSEDAFDAVFSICVIEHIVRDEQIKALTQLSRVLKPGGKLAMTFDYVEDCEELSPHGFVSPEDVETRLIAPCKKLGLLTCGDVDYIHRNPQDVTRPSYDNKVAYGSILFKKPGKLDLPFEPDINLTVGY